MEGEGVEGEEGGRSTRGARKGGDARQNKRMKDSVIKY